MARLYDLLEKYTQIYPKVVRSCVQKRNLVLRTIKARLCAPSSILWSVTRCNDFTRPGFALIHDLVFYRP